MENHSASVAGQPAHYTCHHAREAFPIDGNLDKKVWKVAPQSNRFVDLVTGEPAFMDTRMACLWDDEALYVGFWMQEPQVRASLTEKQLILHEVHHRMKNNIATIKALLSLKANTLADLVAKNAFAEVEGQLDSRGEEKNRQASIACLEGQNTTGWTQTLVLDGTSFIGCVLIALLYLDIVGIGVAIGFAFALRDRRSGSRGGGSTAISLCEEQG